MGLNKSTHPCIKQYGKCKYGIMCKYANIPEDICLNYLSGGCAFGENCTKEHTLYGIDLKEVFPENFQSLRFSSDGKKYMVSDNTKKPKENRQTDASKESQKVNFTEVPRIQCPSRYASAIQVTSKAKIVNKTYKLNQSIPDQKVSVGKHPCIKQLGSCKYGSTCLHKNIDGNVCVFWLNGGCTNPKCTYRHNK